MFSWLVIVTFVVSILFYAMFPRTDAFKTVDKPWSNYYGDILVHQHLSALKASKDRSLATGQEAYNHAVRTGSSGLETQVGNIYYITPSFSYMTDFLRPGEAGGNVYTLGSNAKIKSVILCVDNETGKFLNICAVDFGGEANSSGTRATKKGTSDYLVTFVGLPTTESYLAIRQLGEKMFLMNYNPPELSEAEKESLRKRNKSYTQVNLRTQCGAMIEKTGDDGDFQPGSRYSLDNTRHSKVTVPVVVAKWVEEQVNEPDVLMCITRLFATYDTREAPAELIYPTFQK